MAIVLPVSSAFWQYDLRYKQTLEGVKERFLYAVSLGAISVITGDVGSGKSTALRYASGGLHPGTTSSPS